MLVTASEEEEVRMIVQKEGKLFNVNYPTSFTNLLRPYNSLNIVGHMWKHMCHFIVANVLKLSFSENVSTSLRIWSSKLSPLGKVALYWWKTKLEP
jgi:hypothetical protein